MLRIRFVQYYFVKVQKDSVDIDDEGFSSNPTLLEGGIPIAAAEVGKEKQ